MRELIEKIKRSDLLYMIGFLIYNLFILLVWKVSSAELFVNQISFAASAISILMAVFAILYAWHQAKEATAQHLLVRKTLQTMNQKMEDLRSLEQQIKKEISDNSNLGEGMKLISQGLQQLKRQKSLSKNTVKQIEVLEQKNQELMSQVIGLSDLSVVYHKEELNTISSLINEYPIGDWFTLKELVRNIQVVDEHKSRQDAQSMVLFYLAHLNLLGYIRSKNNQYTRIKEIPIMEQDD